MKIIPCRGSGDGKDTGTNSESGTRNLETGSRAESTEGCEVGDSHRDKTSSARDTFLAECLSCTEFFVELIASGEVESEE